VYWPALHGGFVLDDELLTQDKLIKAPDGLYRLWFTTEPADYWPVTSSSFWFEWRLWGDKPTGYHITNLVLHIVDSLLLWLLLRRLDISGAFLAAVIFAVHPVNVESVAWISQRKNLLALLFLLLSALCYWKADWRLSSATHERPKSGMGPWYLLSLMLFVLGMLSKGSVAVLPALLLLIIWWRRPVLKWDVARAAPFFLLGGLLVLLNMWFQTHGTDAIVRNVTPIDRLLGAGAVVWFYLFKALLPIHLSFVYPQWNIQAGDFRWWLPLVAALAVTALLVWQRKTRFGRPLLIAWAFFCISLVPVMGFTDVGYMQFSLVADHYQHIAMIGIITLIAAGWTTWRESQRGKIRPSLDIVAAAYIGGLMLLSFQQADEYRDAVTLYRATLEKNPNCWLAYNNLGNYYRNASQFDHSIEQYTRSLEIKPDQPKVYGMLGVVQVENGQSDQAMTSFEKAVALDPRNADVQCNWGVALKKLGHFSEAAEHLRRAIELKSDNPVYYNDLGQLYLETGQVDAAVRFLEVAHKLDPDEVNICAALAIAYGHAGRAADAVTTGQQALKMARWQNQTALAKKIEDWLASFEKTNGDPPGTTHP
jgi:protein O-mannosyl-transferase